MSPHLEEKLYREFPDLFEYAIPGRSKVEYPIEYGIECGDGWFHPIFTLCCMIHNEFINRQRDIEFTKRHNERVDAGELIGKRRRVPKKIKYPKVVQIKSKFGSLRFYVNNTTTEMASAISYTELLCSVIDPLNGQFKPFPTTKDQDE